MSKADDGCAPLTGLLVRLRPVDGGAALPVVERRAREPSVRGGAFREQ